MDRLNKCKNEQIVLIIIMFLLAFLTAFLGFRAGINDFEENHCIEIDTYMNCDKTHEEFINDIYEKGVGRRDCEEKSIYKCWEGKKPNKSKCMKNN